MLHRWERGRTFLDLLYQPAPQFRLPGGETIVCRCEEVTARQVIELTSGGCPGPNQLKAFSRCGMGPCQGRSCGLTVTELMAKTRGVPCAEIGYFNLPTGQAAHALRVGQPAIGRGSAPSSSA
jgi:bacterioferritin-associated ferredoxin